MLKDKLSGMKVLYISDRRMGGIANHVKCLTECLPPEVGRYVIGDGGDEEFAGRNGHDIREFFQIRRAIRTFKPDVVHFHIPNVIMALCVRIVGLLDLGSFDWLIGGCRKSDNPKSNNPTISLVCSWHTPTSRKPSWGQRLFFWLLGKDCYYLPVSSATWEGLKKWLPYAKGEVFFNPIRLGVGGRCRCRVEGRNFVVGMVGRNADEKDWPSFHRVEEKVKEKFSDCLIGGLLDLRLVDCLIGGKGVSDNPTISSVEFLNAGEKEVCNGREAIAKMDLFVMTSKHEELPTTVLECFLMGTPICGFIPVGGMSDILRFSNGPVRDVFIAERSCEKLADIVMDLMAHPEKRQAIVEDGRQILTNHFDAEKNCRGQLMRVYERLKGWGVDGGS